MISVIINGLQDTLELDRRLEDNSSYRDRIRNYIFKKDLPYHSRDWFMISYKGITIPGIYVINDSDQLMNLETNEVVTSDYVLENLPKKKKSDGFFSKLLKLLT